ncbi:MAG: OFA family MFS transporter [Thermovirgaceae bacterium]|nr:OFA family MFS transporter [Thermovirgaceae bacterium]
MSEKFRTGWIVVLAGTGINLTFGVLYSWSVFAANIMETYGWTSIQASLPYTFAILSFALLMIPGGRLQDIFGARIISTVAGILVGTGLILASFVPTIPGFVLGFGVIAGSGIGMGYASTTPVAIKWFPPEKKGLITGIVVAGFGLASLYIAPLTRFLISSFGLLNAFRILGVCFLVVVVSLAQLLKAPENPVPHKPSLKGSLRIPARDLTWRQMIKTPQFAQLWIMFAAGALAGLMIIGHLTKIASIQIGQDVGFLLVAGIAVFNSAGRPLAGMISDKLGRSRTMMILYLCQGVVLLAFPLFRSFGTVLFGAAVVTFAYGAMLSVYPSAVGDFYGTKNLGLNYGILFTAWGVGGIVGPILAGAIVDATGGYWFAYMAAGAFCFIAAAMGWMIKPMPKEPAAEVA